MDCSGYDANINKLRAAHAIINTIEHAIITLKFFLKSLAVFGSTPVKPVKTNTVIIAIKLIAANTIFNNGLSKTLDCLASVNGAGVLIPIVVLYYFISGAIRVGIGRSIRKMTNMKNMKRTKKATGMMIR